MTLKDIFVFKKKFLGFMSHCDC